MKPDPQPPATLMLPARAASLIETLNADTDDPWTYLIEPAGTEWVRVVAIDEDGARHTI
jgi:hypothetical protein